MRRGWVWDSRKHQTLKRKRRRSPGRQRQWGVLRQKQGGPDLGEQSAPEGRGRASCKELWEEKVSLHQGQCWWLAEGSEDRSRLAGKESWGHAQACLLHVYYLHLSQHRADRPLWLIHFLLCLAYSWFAFCFCAYSDVLVFLSLTFLLGENNSKCCWLCSPPSFFSLYKEMAWEMGFEEFHLYLRPVHFEFASLKDQVDNSPPIFITSLLENSDHVDRWAWSGSKEK